MTAKVAVVVRATMIRPKSGIRSDGTDYTLILIVHGSAQKLRLSDSPRPVSHVLAAKSACQGKIT